MTQAMRDCPSCGNEIPVSATRCKYCFTDLSEPEPRRGGGPLVGVVLLALVLAAAGWWTYTSMFGQRQLGNVTVDPAEQRVVLVYTAMGKDPTTRQVSFDEISGIEMQTNESMVGGIEFAVVLVVAGGERLVINKTTTAPLVDYANMIAQHTKKTLTTIDNVETGRDFMGKSGGAAPAGQ